MAVSIQYGLQKCGADAFPLVLREHQDILYKHDGMPITHGTNDAQKLIALVSGKGQHGATKALSQQIRVVGVGSPAYTRIQAQDLCFVVSAVFSNFQISNLQLKYYIDALLISAQSHWETSVVYFRV